MNQQLPELVERAPDVGKSEGPSITKRRKRGEGRIYRRGRIFWVKYYVHGRPVCESSHSDKRRIAEKLLRRRLGEVAAGIAAPPRSARIKYEEIRDALYKDYQMNRRKWLRKRKDGTLYMTEIKHLDRFFGGSRAINITTDRIRDFIHFRQNEQASNGTINRSLAILRRMYRLAIEDGKLRDIPHFPMLKEALPRKGFVEYAHYKRLRLELPEHLRPILAMGFYTGMRLGEILRLRWENVDLLGAQVRLDPGTTKNDEPRTIPLVSEVLEMLRIENHKHAHSKFMFMRNDHPVVSFRKAWISACKRAGLGGLLFHDLRRTGIRNLVRAGVPERVAMAISGHKTRSVFERYNIVSERDLRDAARKLEGYLAGEIGDSTGTVRNVANGRISLTH